jgi:hypothetical protein
MGARVDLEPWLTKRRLAAYLGCSERWINYRMAEGLPHSLIAGRVKFRMSRVEPWLIANGYLEHRAKR